jgi:hypothetical protein
VNKHSGEVVWRAIGAGEQVLHGQWSSPVAANVNGRIQVLFGGGDGWLRAYDAESGHEVWRFDGNPKDARWLPRPRRPLAQLHHWFTGLRRRPRLHCHGAESRARQWERPSRRTVCCTSGTCAERFIVWTRSPAPLYSRPALIGDALYLATARRLYLIAAKP